MKSSIRYMKRVKTADYEHEEIEVFRELQEDESAHTAFANMKAFVFGALGLDTPVKTPATESETPKKEIETKGEVTSPEAKPLEDKLLEVKPEELGNPRLEEEKKSEVQEPKKEEPKEEKAKGERKTRMKVSKNTVYNRELDAHKALIGQFLDGEFPGWRKSDVLPKASKASKELTGKTDFLDGDGKILESFKEAFRPYMA